MKKTTFLIFLLIAFLAAGFAGRINFGSSAQEPYQTRLNPGGGLGIVRHPGPMNMRLLRSGQLKELPAFDPASQNPFQVDLRGLDVSAWDLSGRTKDLFYAAFDAQTTWPKTLPPGFDPGRIMALGKNPGFGIRALHSRGITGQGVGLAIIDQGLLVDHVEYKGGLRSYEEIHCADETSAMHGPAVASIAVGKTVGVAPGVDLYYIAETHGTAESGQFVFDFNYLAQSIDRILEINKGLPDHRKIRVISISVGWDPRQKGYAEITAAVERAKKEGIFVVSSSIFNTYDKKIYFHGLGRDPLADPENYQSYGPGLWWINAFHAGRYKPTSIQDALLVPMDSRCTASPTGNDDYVFYRQGGWSWSIPYLAGLYALACQVKPDVTPEIFWAAAIKTGDSIDFPAQRAMPSEADLAKDIAKILDERIALLKQRVKDSPLEKTMAAIYSQTTGKKIETMSESDFRAWSAAGPAREEVLGSTKPQTLKSIVNPVRLIEALEKRPS